MRGNCIAIDEAISGICYYFMRLPRFLRSRCCCMAQFFRHCEEKLKILTKQSSKKFCKSEFFYYFFWIAARSSTARNDGLDIHTIK
ncbi:hypothetical protein [Rickettsia hoogstraalii]|uniref:hypothetical protein n=1 Tax=Rickettsia hoogstraalii TaxID=467174 RepID=UPI0018CEDE4E|nr:hypothetical protein [Rickettsia hoogstraalii]